MRKENGCGGFYKTAEKSMIVNFISIMQFFLYFSSLEKGCFFQMRPKRKRNPPKEFPLVGGGEGVKLKAQVCMEARKRKQKQKQNGEDCKARVGGAIVRLQR